MLSLVHPKIKGPENLHMIESFAEKWSRKERESGLGDIPSELLPCGVDLLPDSAAPFVTFHEASSPVPLWEKYAAHADWSVADRERVSEYLMIGSDGCGNPICVHQTSHNVVLLEHEDFFRSTQFVNSSVRQLAECLLSYMGENDPDRFRSAVTQVDPAALAEGSFWWNESANIGD